MRRRGDKIKTDFIFFPFADDEIFIFSAGDNLFFCGDIFVFLIFGGKCRLVECASARWAENKAILGVKDKKYIVSGLPFLIFGGKCYPVKRRIARWAENKKGRK